jgi:hypothetical protein
VLSRDERPSDNHRRFPGRVSRLPWLRSITLVATGASGFLTLIQSGERPDRYGQAYACCRASSAGPAKRSAVACEIHQSVELTSGQLLSMILEKTRNSAQKRVRAPVIGSKQISDSPISGLKRRFLW